MCNFSGMIKNVLPSLRQGGAACKGSAADKKSIRSGTAGLRTVGITPAHAGKSVRHAASTPRSRDHPRVCGEKHQLPPFVQHFGGSPPRVRGKAHAAPWGVTTGGITPACAGKRPLNICWRRQKRDHPRACGEKPSAHFSTACCTGSPPHMRGKVILPALRKSQCRITPAHAGKRNGQDQPRSDRQDHPRTCGEKSLNLKNAFPTSGSPPHMRGKEKVGEVNTYEKRITPAHAGKSPPPSAPSGRKKDHPRTCGEKSFKPLTGSWRRGSPPHMRGKGIDASPLVLPVGITPAHAGKSGSGCRTPGWPEDHPRACGEKAPLWYTQCAKRGSPPRMRGKGPSVVYSVCKERITPAHAGKSIQPVCIAPHSGDHPRACGEKHGAPVSLRCSTGSPPRMRGKGDWVSFCNRPSRITPAHAGKRMPEREPGTKR